jgi:hypothetical protein
VPPWVGLREERRIPPMKKRCPILSRWEGENYDVGGETLLPPLLNEKNIEDIDVEGKRSFRNRWGLGSPFTTI